MQHEQENYNHIGAGEISCNEETLCWRTWPCGGCRQSQSYKDFLSNGIGSSATISRSFGATEQITRHELLSINKLVDGCGHEPSVSKRLLKLTEGSEHLVYLDSERPFV
jgi:hypothetical protein